MWHTGWKNKNYPQGSWSPVIYQDFLPLDAHRSAFSFLMFGVKYCELSLLQIID